MPDPELDRWASWLLHRRDGDDPEQRRKALEHLLAIRDRVLNNAALRPGDSVLDVGGGDGLIAFGALRRLGEAGHVILSDVSADLLSHARRIASEMETGERMSFVLADAEDLAPIPSASVDVVTTRSVLIYVDDKGAAFRSLHRVLRAGGRVSILEPINNYFPWARPTSGGTMPRPFAISSRRSGRSRAGVRTAMRRTR
jgi:arsenite methyltransferase